MTRWTGEHDDFICVHGDRRLRAGTCDAYGDADEADVILVEERVEGTGLVGLSAALYRGDRCPVYRSITVVHRNWRGRGVGTRLCAAKVAEIRARGGLPASTVAEDNVQSLRMVRRIIPEESLTLVPARAVRPTPPDDENTP